MKAALIGQSIKASLTPEMHMAEARAQGFDYNYLRFDTALPPFQGQSLEAILDKAQSDGLAGVNITHPFKQHAVDLVDDLTETARLLGAINTVLFVGGQRVGHNTDYVGFRSALRSELSGAAARNVLLIGAGGAGRATALALVDQGCETLFVFDRSREAAVDLTNRLLEARPRANVVCTNGFLQLDVKKLDGVVNATPVGMADYPGVPLDTQLLNPNCWVADIVYFPRETEFLRAARGRGLRTMDGSAMAIYQAAAAFHLITGKIASPVRMKDSFRALVPHEQVST